VGKRPRSMEEMRLFKPEPDSWMSGELLQQPARGGGLSGGQIMSGRSPLEPPIHKLQGARAAAGRRAQGLCIVGKRPRSMEEMRLFNPEPDSWMSGELLQQPARGGGPLGGYKTLEDLGE